MPRSSTIRQLAAEAELDLDEVLVRLWDAGVTNVEDPKDVVPARVVRRARDALSLPNRRDVMSVQYWRQRSGLREEDFLKLVDQLGIRLRPEAKILPKGAVSRLRSELRRTRPSTERPPMVPDGNTEIETNGRDAPLVWMTVGCPRQMQELHADDIEAIHFALADDFARHKDPIAPAGVRDHNLLESAAGRPLTAIGDTRKYPSVEMAAAALLHSLVQNHPFYNGNKRTALVAMTVFLDENGLLLTCSERELFRFVLLLAQHRLVPRHSTELADREVIAAAEWICKHTRPIQKGERPIKWLRLRRILISYDCQLVPARGGNRINISRRVPRRRLLGRTDDRVLQTQISYGDEGREVDRNSLNKIRKDLRLDDLHGIDSAKFYGADDTTVDEFIVTYRKILQRLARL